MTAFPVQGAGLGFRRGSMVAELEAQVSVPNQFFEIAPENWIDVGGSLGKTLRRFSEKHPFVCHGLSLNLGGFAPLDEVFLGKLKQFLKTHQVRCYSEHLSYCGDEGHLYDLMPIPFTEHAVHHVAARIRHTQDILEQRIAIENVSYYAAPGQEMSEAEFILAVLEEANCDLLLDVNNIYVNSINHRYDAAEFLRAMPPERIVYAHIAGHYNEAEDLIIDTHGADVIDPVWALLDVAYAEFGVFPTLLERDFNIPPLTELLREVDTIIAYQDKYEAQERRYA
jgi:uncharacterized protein (UPF0276 family)